jgi:fatty-acyl-CoA synthase/long-chain acyl-CoA synthetase
LVGGASVTEKELLDFCKEKVHERAAQPKHMTIMSELPKTAVGKIFKPELRKMAITRIFNEALENANCAARVTSVVDDKKRGLLAQVTMNGASEAEVGKTLDVYTFGWQAA